MTVTVERLASQDILPSALRGIYVEAFPANEREAWPDLVTAHFDGQQITYIAQQDGLPLGFAFLVDLHPLPMGLLTYLAVAPERRSEGVGGLLLEAIRKDAAALGWESGIAIEVETVRGVTATARTDQFRRLDFYRRHGAVEELDVAYAMPDMLTGEPLPMHLFTLPVDPTAPVIPARRLVESIYAATYPFSTDVLAAILAAETAGTENGFPEAVIEMVEQDRHPITMQLSETHDARVAQMLADPQAYYEQARQRAVEQIRAREQVRRSREK